MQWMCLGDNLESGGVRGRLRLCELGFERAREGGITIGEEVGVGWQWRCSRCDAGSIHIETRLQSRRVVVGAPGSLPSDALRPRPSSDDDVCFSSASGVAEVTLRETILGVEI